MNKIVRRYKGTSSQINNNQENQLFNIDDLQDTSEQFHKSCLQLDQKPHHLQLSLQARAKEQSIYSIKLDGSSEQEKDHEKALLSGISEEELSEEQVIILQNTIDSGNNQQKNYGENQSSKCSTIKSKFQIHKEVTQFSNSTKLPMVLKKIMLFSIIYVLFCLILIILFYQQSYSDFKTVESSFSIMFASSKIVITFSTFFNSVFMQYLNYKGYLEQDDNLAKAMQKELEWSNEQFDEFFSEVSYSNTPQFYLEDFSIITCYQLQLINVSVKFVNFIYYFHRVLIYETIQSETEP